MASETIKIRKAPFYILLIYLSLWLAGNATGETNRILEQAWQVCLSCIGIG